MASMRLNNNMYVRILVEDKANLILSSLLIYASLL